MIGQTFGRLTVLCESEKTAHHKWYICKCDCGNDKVARSDKLKAGRIKSCGCYEIEYRDYLVELGKKIRYTKKVWESMRERAYKYRGKSGPTYKRLGVTVCDRWIKGEDDKSGWQCFLEDMGPRPEGLTLDRINPYGNYEPGNCRWATWEVQHKNRRNKNNKPK